MATDGEEVDLIVKCLQNDLVGEFLSYHFEGYALSEGIQRHLTALYTSQQNGAVEHRESNHYRDGPMYTETN